MAAKNIGPNNGVIHRGWVECVTPTRKNCERGIGRKGWRHRVSQANAGRIKNHGGPGKTIQKTPSDATVNVFRGTDRGLRGKLGGEIKSRPPMFKTCRKGAQSDKAGYEKMKRKPFGLPHRKVPMEDLKNQRHSSPTKKYSQGETQSKCRAVDSTTHTKEGAKKYIARQMGWLVVKNAETP